MKPKKVECLLKDKNMLQNGDDFRIVKWKEELGQRDIDTPFYYWTAFLLGSLAVNLIWIIIMRKYLIVDGTIFSSILIMIVIWIVGAGVLALFKYKYETRYRIEKT